METGIGGIVGGLGAGASPRCGGAKPVGGVRLVTEGCWVSSAGGVVEGPHQALEELEREPMHLP